MHPVFGVRAPPVASLTPELEINHPTLAWTEMASGALLPGGGAGGLAIGGWLIHLAGAPVDWIRRSGGIFFLTSAINGLTIIIAGVLLATGLDGHGGFTLSLLPALLAGAAMLPVAALPRALRRRTRVPRAIGAISAGVLDGCRRIRRLPSAPTPPPPRSRPATSRSVARTRHPRLGVRGGLNPACPESRVQSVSFRPAPARRAARRSRRRR
jgi:hypothetical protein